MIALLTRLFTRGEPALSEAGADDAAAIAALHAASFRHGWSEGEVESLLTDRGVYAHRAMLGRRLVGFILSRVAAGEAEILSIAVADSNKGRGLAGRLLRQHLNRLNSVGVGAVFLEVDENNIPARRLYDRAGFREVGRRQGYYRDRHGHASTALVLRCDFV
jgi:ribosomal-protein-alanine N-acetyltransferase